jgi:hypothetical protein
MSLDNVLAVAGAAQRSTRGILVFGLAAVGRPDGRGRERRSRSLLHKHRWIGHRRPGLSCCTSPLHMISKVTSGAARHGPGPGPAPTTPQPPPRWTSSRTRWPNTTNTNSRAYRPGSGGKSKPAQLGHPGVEEQDRVVARCRPASPPSRAARSAPCAGRRNQFKAEKVSPSVDGRPATSNP